jgi:hypothetical protein
MLDWLPALPPAPTLRWGRRSEWPSAGARHRKPWHRPRVAATAGRRGPHLAAHNLRQKRGREIANNTARTPGGGGGGGGGGARAHSMVRKSVTTRCSCSRPLYLSRMTLLSDCAAIRPTSQRPRDSASAATCQRAAAPGEAEGAGRGRPAAAAGGARGRAPFSRAQHVLLDARRSSFFKRGAQQPGAPPHGKGCDPPRPHATAREAAAPARCRPASRRPAAARRRGRSGQAARARRRARRRRASAPAGRPPPRARPPPRPSLPGRGAAARPRPLESSTCRGPAVRRRTARRGARSTLPARRPPRLPRARGARGRRRGAGGGAGLGRVRFLVRPRPRARGPRPSRRGLPAAGEPGGPERFRPRASRRPRPRRPAGRGTRVRRAPCGAVSGGWRALPLPTVAAGCPSCPASRTPGATPSRVDRGAGTQRRRTRPALSGGRMAPRRAAPGAVRAA